MLALFSDFDQAINPLNLICINLKHSLIIIEKKVDHFKNLGDAKISDIQFKLNRMNQFEDENQRILGKFAELDGKVTYLNVAQSPMKTRRNPAKTK